MTSTSSRAASLKRHCQVESSAQPSPALLRVSLAASENATDFGEGAKYLLLLVSMRYYVQNIPIERSFLESK